MSVRGRNKHTGTLFLTILLMSLGYGVIWFSPWWVEHFFPQLLVGSQEPWQLTVSDLTWHRVLSNMIVKPGFRWLVLMMYEAFILLFKWLVLDAIPSPRWKTWRTQIIHGWTQDSGEFVVEGRRASLLVEYARGIEAV